MGVASQFPPWPQFGPYPLLLPPLSFYRTVVEVLDAGIQ